MKPPIFNFSFVTMNDIYETGTLRDHLDCKKYISRFFVPTTSNSHVLIEDGKVTIIQKDSMKDVYLARFPKDIATWYKTKTIPKKLISDISKPQFGDDYVNLSGRMKHKYQPYKEFSKDIQTRVQVMLDYVKLIWANNREVEFVYLIKWFANMIKGNKNNSCIYAKGEEGIGKSTFIDFIYEYVIGEDLCCKGKADHLKGEHNMQLLGKLLVVFEELQFFSEKEWRAIDSEMKDMITAKMAQYTDKYEKRFCAQNNNNYVVNTNFNSIKGANGRRYYCADINPRYMNDHKYFGYLREQCFNDIVGHAFYCYLMEYDTTNFNSLDYPVTQAKRDLCADLLSPLEKFMKFNYLLKEKKIDILVKDFHEQFETYRAIKKYPPGKSIQDTTKPMRELGFEYVPKNHGYNHYVISVDQLKQLAIKKKWLHELDKDEMKRHSIEDYDKDDDYEEGIDHIDQSEYVRVEIYKALKDENESLKALLKLKGCDVYDTEPDIIDRITINIFNFAKPEVTVTKEDKTESLSKMLMRKQYEDLLRLHKLRQECIRQNYIVKMEFDRMVEEANVISTNIDTINCGMFDEVMDILNGNY
jgi:hypothetical protein